MAQGKRRTTAGKARHRFASGGDRMALPRRKYRTGIKKNPRLPD